MVIHLLLFILLLLCCDDRIGTVIGNPACPNGFCGQRFSYQSSIMPSFSHSYSRNSLTSEERWKRE
ncbi:hypothetical protein PRIPAC_72152 [Pristionchus pacificus]|uniref:Uncharacterized protein n=1 Tax=Pristionchus pacificus TaxID=54126 RepID=A0A2A6C5F2_PRIPA|nr:hypothetical protein PRIPAC_72152 [Pristionchus pacificus]|eukprot:PDM73405.1 hypothetical protein PRIPAC_40761 [Pristionchus pacificus]